MFRLAAAWSAMLLLCATAATAQATGSAEDLIRRERIRAEVEQAFERVNRPTETGAQEIEQFVSSALSLAGLGAEVIPFLTSELEQASPDTYFFCVYALGNIPAPESERALLGAMERADADFGDFAVIRKAWAAFGLGLLGQDEAVDRVNDGKHKSGHYSIHSRFSVLESAALHTYPASFPRLVAQLERYVDDDELIFERTYTIKALAVLRDPKAVPVLLGVLREPNGLMRHEAARALAVFATDEAVAGLIAALDDEDSRVRKAAADSLERILPAGHLDTFVKKLETEQQSVARGSLYALVARLGGVETLPILHKHWGRKDSLDRMFLVAALGHIRSDAVLPMLRVALSDPDMRVIARAVRSVAALGTPAALELLTEGLRSPREPLVQTVAEELEYRLLRPTAPLVARRLLEVELASVVQDPSRRSLIELLSRSLITLGHDAHLEALKKAVERQTDIVLRQALNRQLLQVELLRKNRDDAASWIEALQSTDADVRSLARARLGQIGGKKTARALAESFGRVAPGEGVEILNALGHIDAAPSRELIRRVLVSPAFDDPARLALREMAAWSARRIGGADMLDALRSAVERRDGRDARVAIYLALLGGKDALPTLERCRVPRMRYLKWLMGLELETLDRVADQLRRGRSISDLDVAPDQIRFH